MDIRDFDTWTDWSSEIGEYKLACITHEEPTDTFTITVTEAGVELERRVVVQEGPHDWEAPHKVAEELRLKYQPRFIAQLLSNSRK